MTASPRRSPTIWRALIGVALAASLAACSGDYDRYATAPNTTQPGRTTVPPTTTTTTTRPATTTTTTTVPASTTTVRPGSAPTTTTPTTPKQPDGILAVITDDGGLITVRPDGTGVTTIADPPASGTNSQPAWSPDATRLAFPAQAAVTGAVRVATLATPGPIPQQLLTPPPAYVAWDPTQTRLAYLRALGTGEFELGVLDSSAATAPKVLRTGSSVFASWSPDGTRLVAHVDDELMLLDPAGQVTALGATAGASTAPIWAGPTTVLVAIRTEQGQLLSLLDVITGARKDLLSYTGVISYLLDPSGTKVAFETQPGVTGGGGSRVSYPFRQGAAVPQAPDQELTILDIAGGALTQVIDETAAAFQWRPDGGRLAFLQQASGAAQWRFWSTDDIIDGAMFSPSIASSQSVLRFFEQFAQSVRWWSPNGEGFVFAGRVNGRDGIWVQPVVKGATPAQVSDGQLVAWSPKEPSR
jgi:Tol biopolymer transport system component